MKMEPQMFNCMENKKRKCRVDTRRNVSTGQRTNIIGHIFDGMFHGWGVKTFPKNALFECGENTVAIIEDENGHVHLVFAEYVQFLDK